MNFKPNTPARDFAAGETSILIHDCGEMFLNQNEQITFKRESGAEYDVTAKEWGFYATPSTNGRLSKFGFRTALVSNAKNKRRYVLLVEKGFEDSFNSYLKAEALVIEMWLDDESEIMFK
jgi:hypothetical protein